MKNSPYFKQAQLMLRVMPHVAAERSFALKGGTAINLFFRDMPRLSVDIDLTWMPLEPREETLENISAALLRVAEGIRRTIPGTIVREIRTRGAEQVSKLAIGTSEATIKIEPNLVLRGSVFPDEERGLCESAEKLFELSVSTNTMAMADLYGGKLCAALDRQHPRDIFDLKILVENEGITNEIRTAFVVYLASHDRPMSELLDPGRKDFRQAYDHEFAGMSGEPAGYAELVDVRDWVVDTIRDILTENERSFLLSIKKGQPDWTLLSLAGIDQLPGIRWKLINIRKMNKEKHLQALIKLRKVLGI